MEVPLQHFTNTLKSGDLSFGPIAAR